MPEQLEIGCESCGAKILFEPLVRTARCPYCDSPSVVDRPATPDRPDPIFALAFRIDQNDAKSRMRRWLKSKRWAPTGIRTAVLLKGLVTRRFAFPSWVLAYRYRGNLYRTVLSGQDADRIRGTAPISAAKIALTIGAVLIGAGLLLTLLVTLG